MSQRTAQRAPSAGPNCWEVVEETANVVKRRRDSRDCPRTPSRRFPGRGRTPRPGWRGRGCAGRRREPAAVQQVRTAFRSSSRRASIEVVVHTDQHWYHDMSQVFFDQSRILGASPTTRPAQHPTSTRMQRPDPRSALPPSEPDTWWSSCGDTNSTLAGHARGCDATILLAHAEAGLRQRRPGSMPEEHNRIEVDRLASACSSGAGTTHRSGDFTAKGWTGRSTSSAT